MVGGGPEVFDLFYISSKNCKLPGKCETNFICCIRKHLFTHSAQYKMGIQCSTENMQTKLQLFPHESQHASFDCRDDIPDPYLWIIDSCNPRSIYLIINITSQESRIVMSRDRGGQASNQRVGNVVLWHLGASSGSWTNFMHEPIKISFAFFPGNLQFLTEL
jgi:hypothetical protein